MSIKRISSNGLYEDKIGYCRAVIAGDYIHVSGTTAQGETVSPDVVAQCKSAIETIERALKEAGAGLEDVVRVSYYLPDHRDFEPCWDTLSSAFGKNPPAATMIECGLIDPRYKIEIEVTAYKPR